MNGTMLTALVVVGTPGTPVRCATAPGTRVARYAMLHGMKGPAQNNTGQVRFGTVGGDASVSGTTTGKQPFALEPGQGYSLDMGGELIDLYQLVVDADSAGDGLVILWV